MSSRVVVIGPSTALPGLTERFAGTNDVRGFSEDEALEALDYIIRTKPSLVVVDQDFSRTPRGGALINRIKDDPSLPSCEVRVMPPGLPLPPGVAAAGGAGKRPALDQRGTRRAPRIRIREGVEVLADGSPATLVDLSRAGAQIVSRNVLKPNQRIRIVMGDGPGAVRCNGSVAWAAFEMPKGEGTRYRAGVDFIGADADAVQAFADQHRSD